MRYLTLEEVVVIHDVVVKKTGGSYGVRDPALLQAAVSRPQASFGGVDFYDSVWVKAAVLMQGIIQNYPFVDGNKRTGVAAATVFLKLNGYDLTFEDSEGLDLTMRVARGVVELEEIAEWMEDHSGKE